ncbi:MAG: PAS domain S-box protein [Chroococcidiopsidaceae cyanobacterium CP_BM_ER_R8_30]|nr:PAS domain S-box protein [Chroococcidiopsidaceae cyanobacterium CP_BM_ER_R8_30]
MKEEKFFQQLKLLYERMSTLQKDTRAAPREQQEWLPVALEELNTAFLELQVAEEELRTQNEALSIARQTVEAERQRYQDLFQEAPDGYLVTDGEGKIQEANDAAARLLNIKSQFLVGKPIVNFLVASERQNFRTKLNQLRQGNQVAEWEVRLQPRISRLENPVTLDVAMKVSTIRNWEGKSVTLRWLVRDVTERKQVLERLRLLESVVVNANDAVLITEAEPLDEPGPRILYVNEAFTHMTGYGQEEVLGLTPRFLQGPLTDRSVLAKLKASLKKFEPVVAEVINYRKEGTEFWVEMSMRPVADETGYYTHWVSVQRDITERKRAEAARAQLLYEQAARAEAEASNRMKDEFLAIVSHELRSPLNAILGWARLLRARKFDPEKTEQALSIIERNAQAQTQLIEDLLDISRIIRGQVRLYNRPTDLKQVIEAAIETLRPAADTKTIQVESQFHYVGLVNGDPDRLQQVVCNLLSNAIKFTPRGGWVEVRLGSSNSQAQIQVIDTGIGISPDFLPYIFERFRQAEGTTTRAHNGLGLGLAIVRHIVELHHGTIRVESQGLGQGATFIVQLPLSTHALGVSAVESLLAQKQDLFEDSQSLSGLRVLVVDDEIDTREFLVTALEQVGAEVKAAASVGEAMQQLECSSADVLLSDIGMPIEDGYALIKKIRALAPEQGGQIKAAALTAFAREEDRIQALLAGFQMHVPKPIDPRQLVAVVAQLAGRLT